MYDDELRLLMQALGESVLQGQGDPTGTVAMLISETVKFRDKLKDETGYVLTVGDTRTSLDALEQYLHTKSLPENLSAEQKALTQIWIDRLTVFKSK